MRKRAAATCATRTRSRGARRAPGRARAGDVASPLWRGGGKIFPNSPDENFSQKLNRKMYRAGMCSILSQLAREDRLKVVETFSVDAPKTKLLAQKVKQDGHRVGAGDHRQRRREPDAVVAQPANVRVLDVATPIRCP